MFAMSVSAERFCGSVPAMIAPAWSKLAPIPLAPEDLLRVDEEEAEYLLLSKRSVALCQFILGGVRRQHKA